MVSHLNPTIHRRKEETSTPIAEASAASVSYDSGGEEDESAASSRTPLARKHKLLQYVEESPAAESSSAAQVVSPPPPARQLRGHKSPAAAPIIKDQVKPPTDEGQAQQVFPRLVDVWSEKERKAEPSQVVEVVQKEAAKGISPIVPLQDDGETLPPVLTPVEPIAQAVVEPAKKPVVPDDDEPQKEVPEVTPQTPPSLAPPSPPAQVLGNAVSPSSLVHPSRLLFFFFGLCGNRVGFLSNVFVVEPFLE